MWFPVAVWQVRLRTAISVYLESEVTEASRFRSICIHRHVSQREPWHTHVARLLFDFAAHHLTVDPRDLYNAHMEIGRGRRPPRGAPPPSYFHVSVVEVARVDSQMMCGEIEEQSCDMGMPRLAL